MRAFSYTRAQSLEAAVGAADADYLAGGTTLIDLIKLDVMRPTRVVDLNRLPLDTIEPASDGGLRIGANVRNSVLAWDDTIKRDYPLIAQAVLQGASAQIRNMATTAGNLRQRVRCPYFRDGRSPCNKREPGTGCAAWEGYNRMHAILGGSEACIATHPSDLCVALVALDAAVVMRGPQGERALPIGEFHLLPGETPHLEHALGPGEVITAVTLSPGPAKARSHYLKVRDRQSYEFALASAAVRLVVDHDTIREARVAMGGIGTKPWRSPEAEAVLRNAPATRTTFEAAADAALADARPRRHNAFKVPLARQTLIRALENALAAV